MKIYPYPTRKGLEKLRDFSTRVIRNMGRNALRRIHEVHKATGTLPTVDELESWIIDHHPRARYDFDDAERKATSAAVFALDAFDPAEYERRVQRARNGGKVSGHKKGARGVRRPEYGSEALQDGLSIREQALALGKSVATIKRMRAIKKAEEAAAFEAELIELFGAPEVNSETQPEETASEPVITSITAMPINIRTRKPISALQAAIEEFAAEEAAGPYAHMDEYAEVAGL